MLFAGSPFSLLRSQSSSFPPARPEGENAGVGGSENPPNHFSSLYEIKMASSASISETLVLLYQSNIPSCSPSKCHQTSLEPCLLSKRGTSDLPQLRATKGLRCPTQRGPKVPPVMGPNAGTSGKCSTSSQEESLAAPLSHIQDGFSCRIMGCDREGLVKGIRQQLQD